MFKGRKEKVVDEVDMQIEDLKDLNEEDMVTVQGDDSDIEEM
jgi:hypothetical protein